MGQIVNVDEHRRQRISESKVERAFEITPSDIDDLSHPTINSKICSFQKHHRAPAYYWQFVLRKQHLKKKIPATLK